jgi:hypothetical protein
VSTYFEDTTLDKRNRPIQTTQLELNAFQGILTSPNTLLFKSDPIADIPDDSVRKWRPYPPQSAAGRWIHPPIPRVRNTPRPSRSEHSELHRPAVPTMHPVTTGGPATEAQNWPGVVYHTESNFFDPTVATTNGLELAGSATQATPVMAKFSNIPAGVGLYVSVTRTGTSTSNAVLVSTDANGAGPINPLPATVTPGMRQLTVTNGTATAVWEVTP